MEVNNASSMNGALEEITTELRSLSSSVAMSSFVNPCETQPTVCGKPIGVYFSELADRIEELWKREEKAIATENAVLPAVCITKPSCNAAAMRDTLKKIAAMDIPHNFQNERFDIADACYDLTHAIKEARAVLSAPQRNCDVGTAEEQEKRFEKFCSMYHLPKGKGCYSCPAIPTRSPNAFHRNVCRINWNQMPYEAKEGGTE